MVPVAGKSILAGELSTGIGTGIGGCSSCPSHRGLEELSQRRADLQALGLSLIAKMCLSLPQRCSLDSPGASPATAAGSSCPRPASSRIPACARLGKPEGGSCRDRLPVKPVVTKCQPRASTRSSQIMIRITIIALDGRGGEGVLCPSPFPLVIAALPGRIRFCRISNCKPWKHKEKQQQPPGGRDAPRPAVTGTTRIQLP